MTSPEPPDRFSRKPTPEDVRAELARLLDSPGFRSNAARRALLSYLVEETLAGRASRLKGFTIAVSVFGRDETFDAQADPLVRLEAMRLRQDLDIYYGTAGLSDPLRISVPKGAYIPAFEWQETRPGGSDTAPPPAASDDTGPAPAPAAMTAAHPVWRRVAVATLLVLVLVMGLGLAGWLLWPRTDSPDATVARQERGASVVVLPFRALTGSKEDDYLAFGFAQQLTAALLRFPGLTLYSRPLPAGTDPASASRSLPVAYAVEGSVGSSGGRTRVSVELTEVTSGRVLWSAIFDRQITPDNLLDMQENLATHIATELGQPYGVVRSTLTEQFASNRPRSMEAYGCVLEAYVYRRTFSRALRPGVRSCLEKAVALDPGYADALALLAWLHLDVVRFGDPTPEESREELHTARDLARRSVELAPRNLVSRQALAAVTYYQGSFDEAEKLQREILALSPNDPETLAQLGWRLMLRGHLEDGVGYVRQAIDHTADAPAWYTFFIAFHDYLNGNYQAALEPAMKAREDEFGGGWALYAMVEAELGHPAEARAALAEMAARAPALARDPDAWCRKHGMTDALRQRFIAGMKKAGWTPPVPPATTAQ